MSPRPRARAFPLVLWGLATGCLAEGYLGQDTAVRDDPATYDLEPPDVATPGPVDSPSDVDTGPDPEPDTGSAEGPSDCQSDNAGLAVVLTWQLSGDDMDLHLLAPGGTLETESDCYFANCVDWGFTSLDWGEPGQDGDPVLAEDDINGTGPERIVLMEPADGDYEVWVHDYPGSAYDPVNRVTVRICLDGHTALLTTRDIAGEDTYLQIATVSLPRGGVSETP